MKYLAVNLGALAKGLMVGLTFSGLAYVAWRIISSLQASGSLTSY